MSGGIEGEGPRIEPPSQQPKPEQKQQSPEAGAGPLGLPPPDTKQLLHSGEPKSPERQKRTYIIYNPKKETLEEFRKRYEQAQAERREKRREYQRSYMKRYREKNNESANLEQKQPEAIQIFPSVTKP